MLRQKTGGGVLYVALPGACVKGEDSIPVMDLNMHAVRSKTAGPNANDPRRRTRCTLIYIRRGWGKKEKARDVGSVANIVR